MGKKFTPITLILPIVLILLTSVASAEVWLVKQPEPIYNIGDELEISASVSAIGKQLKAELICANETKPFFLQHLSNKTEVDILQPLTKDFLGNFSGKCKIILKYGQESAESSLKISDVVFLKISIDQLSYEPEEKIIIKGDAEKANTQLLDGFFTLFLEKINLTTTGPVEAGKFEANILLPADIAAGPYLINITVYEKEDEQITNIGKTRLSIRVKQIPKKVGVALASQNIKPGNNLEFKIMLYDQSGDTIEGEASFLIEDSNGLSYLKALTKIDKSENFFIEKNFSSGYYKIKAYSSGIYGEREFYVEENKEVEFKIINGTLTVRNIGNVKYNRAIQVKISDVVEIINIALALGEEKKYQLKAPDGSYDIFITDGEKSMSSEAVILTGSAVNVKEIGRSFFARNKFLAWLFLILVMGMFIFTGARRVLKKKFVLSGEGPQAGKTVKGAGVIKVGKKEKGELKIVKDTKEAEHSLVLKGQKQDVTLICLKTKNKLSKTAKESLEKVLKEAQEAKDTKSVIYKSGDCSLIIFSPLITRTFKNHVPAVKVALDLAKTLKEYNSRAQDKIDFGIAVHSGNMVNTLQENKLKFTSLGNTLTLAKKLSELSKQNVLLSKDLHEKTIADIKTEKQEMRGVEVFTVNRIMDTQRNKMFVQDFLKKMADEGNQQKEQNNQQK